MLILHNFSVSQILHELEVGVSRVSKFGILTDLVTLIIDFYAFLLFCKAEIYQNGKLRHPKMAKTTDLEVLDPSKLISC